MTMASLQKLSDKRVSRHLNDDGQQPGTSSRHVGSDSVSIDNQNSNIDMLLEEFIKVFVRKFEEKFDEYKIEAAVGGTPKPGKIADKVAMPLVGAPLAAAGLVSGVPGAAGGGWKLGGTAASTLWKLKSGKDHRQEAKRAIEVLRRIDKDKLRGILVEAGGDIFQSFESQFVMVTDANGSCTRAMEKLAVDASNRVINSIIDYKGEDTEVYYPDLITKGVIFGKSKRGYGSTVVNFLKADSLIKASFVPESIRSIIPKPGHTVKIKNTEEKWKTASLYEEVGIVTIIDNNGDKYYRNNNNDNADKYGYRLQLKWENELYMINEYKESNKPSDKYKYIIKPTEMERKLKIILDEINKEDLQLAIKRIESKIDTIVPRNDHGKRSIWFDMKEPVKLFTGRSYELDTLHNELLSAGGQVVISQTASISGLGGIGKSELARKYAYSYREYYDNNGIWINSETQESLKKSFQELAKELNIPIVETIGMKEQERDVKSIARDTYKSFNYAKSLFIFDNAEDYKDIKEFLPTSLSPDLEKPYVLITSRNQDWKVGEEGEIQVITLKEFTPEEAIQFVKEFLKIKNDLQDKSIKKLTEVLQCFPLALRQAVVYIEQENETANKRGDEEFKIDHYLQKYQQQQTKKLLDQGYWENSDRYAKTVLTTWNITLEKIGDHKHGKLAIDILNMMAFFAPDKVNIREFFSRLEKALLLWNAVELLDKYSMIHLERGLSNIHRLVQQVIRLKLENGGEEEGVLRKTLQLINNCNIEDNSVNHVASVWNYTSKYAKLIDDFYFSSNSIYGYHNATPVHLLAENGSGDAVKNILGRIKEKHLSTMSQVINAKDKYSRTPVYMAAEHGYLGVVKLLIKEKAEINTVSSVAYASLSTKLASNWTPLHIAAFNGHVDIVKFLVIEGKAPTDINDSISRTPAVLAAFNGHIDVVNFLKPNDYVYLLHTHIRIAMKTGNLEQLNSFIRDLENKGQLKDIINSKLSEWAPIHMAAFAGWSNITTILLSNGAKIKDLDKSFTPLHSASSNGHLNVVTLLIDKGADPKDTNKSGWTSLHAAAQNGNLEVVEYFINELNNEKAIDVNIPDEQGTTPLHTAAFHGKLHVVDFLLGEDIKHKADINAIDKLGRTPMFSAALNNHCDIVKFLLNKEAVLLNNADNKTLIGRLNLSVLHVTAAYDAEEIVRILVDKGIDKDIGKDTSLTPLHIAAFFGSSKVIEYLINQGAEIDTDIKFSIILSVLSDLKASNMSSVINKLHSSLSYFADYLQLTPSRIYNIFNYPDNELLGETRHNSLLDKAKEKLIKWIFNLDYVRRQTDSLKVYVGHNKNPDLSRPIDTMFYEGKDNHVNAQDENGNTVLHIAVKDGNAESVKYLINEKMADPNITDKNGKSPLDLAVEKFAQAQDHAIPEKDDYQTIIDLLLGVNHV